MTRLYSFPFRLHYTRHSIYYYPPPLFLYCFSTPLPLRRAVFRDLSSDLYSNLRDSKIALKVTWDGRFNEREVVRGGLSWSFSYLIKEERKCRFGMGKLCRHDFFLFQLIRCCAGAFCAHIQRFEMQNIQNLPYVSLRI